MLTDKIVNIFRPTTLTLYAGVVLSLAVTTVLSPEVYGSAWFIILWGLFALILAGVIISGRMWRKGGSFLLHISFIAMLGGGLLTWLTQESGRVRIAPGECVTSFISESGDRYDLPCAIELERFEIKYYPGGRVPLDYISHLVVDGNKQTVSMNHILDLEGYRLLQASYDSEGGTVLSVNHDPYGIFLSYAGYIMFAIGGLWVMLTPSGRLRKLVRSLAVVISLISLTSSAYASNESSLSKTAGVPKEMADSLRSRQVLYGGRVVTFNTLARDVVTKLYGKPTYRGLTPEQTLLSFRMFPEVWKDQPLIFIKDKAVARALGVGNGYASLSNLFDSLGNYRVSPLYTTLGENSGRGVEEVDEKAGILLTLLSGDLIVSLPADIPPLPSWRVNMELIYNSIPFGNMIFMMLFSGFILSALSLIVAGRIEKWLVIMAKIILWAALIVSLFNFIFQWVLSSRLPLANTYETLEFVVFVTEIIVVVMAGRNRLLMPLGMLFAGALALVAHLVEVNPMVTPLMPVLHSPWLSLHVSLVMTSYAILSFTFIISLTALIRKGMGEYLRRLSMVLLYPGVWLLGLGIFTGAVWANVSWGQYWSWDPKETWALVTFLVYAFPLHCGYFKILRGTRSFHLYLLLAILSIAMTYFGVNYLNSMHAYN